MVDLVDGLVDMLVEDDPVELVSEDAMGDVVTDPVLVKVVEVVWLVVAD